MADLKKQIGKTIIQWLDHEPFMHSAAAAYYSVFSMPGLLMVVTAIATVGFDRQVVEDGILNNIRAVLGPNVAVAMQEIVANTQSNDRDFWSMAMGIATLIFGATGLFIHMQSALNNIWQVQVKKTVNWRELHARSCGAGT